MLHDHICFIFVCSRLLFIFMAQLLNICGTLCVKSIRNVLCQQWVIVYFVLIMRIVSLMWCSAIWYLGNVFLFCNPSVMSFNKELFLPVYVWSSIYVVFDNRTDAVTPCMTLLDAVAKRNWGGREKYSHGVVLTVIHHHVYAQTCYCMPVITTNSGNFKYFTTSGPWVLPKSNNKNSFTVETFMLAGKMHTPEHLYDW